MANNEIRISFEEASSQTMVQAALLISHLHEQLEKSKEKVTELQAQLTREVEKRRDAEMHITSVGGSSLRTLQSEQEEWAMENFGPQPSYLSLLGAMEELGELSHAHLKAVQRIRQTDAARSKELKEDAIGDIIVFLAGYCNGEGIDLEEAVFRTWGSVKNRNWRKNPSNGGEIPGVVV